jgi:uncharacterized protein YkwD
MRSMMIKTAAAGVALLLAQAASAQQVLAGGDYVKAHNDLRAKHCVPPLKISKTLEADAARWALELAKKGEVEHESMDKRKGAGENLYTASRSASQYTLGDEVHREAAASWYSEIKDYRFNATNPSEEKGEGDIGHFTQLVWKASTEVGCANATYAKDGMFTVVSVCRYAPMGNDVSDNGALYKTNVPKVCK